MRVLDRKLLRDLLRLRGQVLAIALVVASGTGLLVMALSSLSSLQSTAETYYDRYRFADVFATLVRAPESLTVRIAEIPGVQSVETRISVLASVNVSGLDEPVIGRLISLPRRGPGLLNRLALREGRLADPARADEVVLNEPFAQAHGLRPGDRLRVLMRGVQRELTVVGLALSPEYVYATAPGALMPDDERFGVLWLGREALAAAYDLDGSFNDVSLAYLRGARIGDIIDRLDDLLEPYGGTGAIARADQLSNWFLQNEFESIRQMGTVLPAIFLAVAAFLSNTAIARLIATERSEISLMKAFGYSAISIGWHYLKLVLAITMIGMLLGWGLGLLLGRYDTSLRAEFFRFPFLFFRPGWAEFVISGGAALLSTTAGAIWSIRSGVRLPPAEAMRPPLPDSFRGAALPAAISTRLDSPTRIILRQIIRTPLRSAMTVAGLSLGLGVLITALQWPDAITRMAESQFHDSQHQDITVSFYQTTPIAAQLNLARLPGILRVEPMRIVPAEISVGHLTHRGALTGLPGDADLQVIHDERGWQMPVPAGGLVIGTYLAAKLGIGVGDTVSVKVLGRSRATFDIAVTGLVETGLGTPAYLEIDSLNRLLSDPPVLNLASLLVDEAEESAFFSEIKEVPGISAVVVKRRALQQFHDTLGETILIFVGFFVAFSSALAYGVVYNATRIALSERGRDLATLRVLGFTRWEISYILLGETALLVLLSLPPGCLAGYGLAALIGQAFQTELFRMPLNIEPHSLGLAVLIIMAAVAVSAAIVRRRLDRLDMIAVLKTRE